MSDDLQPDTETRSAKPAKKRRAKKAVVESGNADVPPASESVVSEPPVEALAAEPATLVVVESAETAPDAADGVPAAIISAPADAPTDTSTEVSPPAIETETETQPAAADEAVESGSQESAEPSPATTESGETPATTESASAPVPVISLEEFGHIVEALLFAAEEPLSIREMARAVSSDSATIREVIKNLKSRYETENRAWDLAEVSEGYRLVTRAQFYPYIQRLKTQTAQRKLTQAALETLSLIAYRQPITRAEIESVRGVGAGPVVRQLLDRKLIKISGRAMGLGQPLLYSTTSYFLEHFGLKTIEQLPRPGEFKNT